MWWAATIRSDAVGPDQADAVGPARLARSRRPTYSPSQRTFRGT
jgi:hypothetical protein